MTRRSAFRLFICLVGLLLTVSLLFACDGAQTPADTVPETVDAAHTAAVLSAFLRSLPPAECDVFLRRYWFGDRVKDLARERFTTENALSVRLSRLRQKCKDHLIKEGFFDEA